jgi:hypothetical protein
VTGQMDLFDDATVAEPSPRSVTEMRPKVAERIGCLFRAACRHCTDPIRMVKRRGTWTHDHGAVECNPTRRRTGEWRIKEDGGVA